MGLSPLERQAAFLAACKLRRITRIEASAELGATWTHVSRVLDDAAQGSAELNAKIERFLAPARALGRKLDRIERSRRPPATRRAA